MFNYADLTDEERAKLDELMCKRAERRQARDVERAAALGSFRSLKTESAGGMPPSLRVTDGRPRFPRRGHP